MNAMGTTYAINVQVVVTKPEGTSTHQLPTFYLDANVQGITSGDEAVNVARQIVDPRFQTMDGRAMNDCYRIQYHITAVPVTPDLITRNEYMANSDELHHAYYMQFVTKETERFISECIGLDKLRKSKDKWFNDIIKHSRNGLGGWIWDSTPCNIALMREAGELSAHGLPSMATHTCVGKACARDLLAKEGAQS